MVTYQRVTGIGASLEASTCYNIARLTPAARAELMQQLFHVDEGIGLSLMRVTIGTSDFTPPPYYSYDDSLQPDPSLSNFSVSADRSFIIPCIIGALHAQPQVS
jgi:O-glycosyl hydrolase